MLAISRALMGKPKLLLLDEPSLGLSPLLVQQIFGIIRRINGEQGVAILLVEQNAHIALQTADYGYVLEVGRIVLADDCTDADAARTTSRNSTSARRKPASAAQRRWKRKRLWKLTIRDEPVSNCPGPGRAAVERTTAWRQDHPAQEGPWHLEGRHLVAARRARARDRSGAAARSASARRRRVASCRRPGPEAVYADLAILGSGGGQRGDPPRRGGRPRSAHPVRRPAAACVFVENEEQLDKVLSVRDALPGAVAHRHLRHEGPARLRTTRSASAWPASPIATRAVATGPPRHAPCTGPAGDVLFPW